MSKVHVSNQYAAQSVSSRQAFADRATPVIESALHHANLRKLSARTRSHEGVNLCELPVTGLLVLRAQNDISTLNSALASVLNLNLPSNLHCSTFTGTSSSNPCIRWVAPDEWLLSCALEDTLAIEQNLRLYANDASLAIVNVSGGFSVIELSGVHAIDVLKKSTAYDVHPANFYTGKVVNTVFAKAQISLRCVESDHYELIVRRSYTDYLWHWIQVAAAEYGLSISVANS